MQLSKIQAILLILAAMLISFLLHAKHFQKDLMGMHVWRQTLTQNTIESYYEEDMNILNPRQSDRENRDGIFRMEFPLMQWSIAAVYKLAGKHIWITRGFVFLCYLFGVAGFARLCRYLFNSKPAAVAGAWAFCFSPSIFYFGINPLPDVLALAFCAWGLSYFVQYSQKGMIKSVVIASCFFCLSTLVKLPFILFFGLPLYWLLEKSIQQKSITSQVKPVAIIIAAMVLPIAWYAWVIGGWTGNGIVTGLLDSDKSFATLAGYVKHHLVSTLPELFINYAAIPLFLLAIYQFFKKRLWTNVRARVWIVGLLAVTAYFLFEINMIADVHDYYLFPFYPFVIILIVYGFQQTWRLKQKLGYTAVFLLFCTPLTAYLRTANSWNPGNPGFNTDWLVYKQQLRQAVPDSALVVVGNDMSRNIFFYYTHKKGWVFDSDNYDDGKLSKAIAGGAQFLYCDSHALLAKPGISKHLVQKIASYGSIDIYKLQ